MIKVTDHAVLRHLQRVDGVDVESVRQRIAETVNRPRAADLVRFAGDAPFKVKAQDLIYCVRAGAVTTCYQRPRRRRPRGQEPSW